MTETAKYLCIIWAPLLFAILPVPAVPAQENIIATIGENVVTQKEIEEAIDVLPEPEMAKLKEDRQKLRKFIDNYISWRLVLNEAQKRELENTEDFERRIKRARNDILISLLARALRHEIKVNDEDAKRYYEKHIDQFSQPEERRARQILVKERGLALELIGRIKKGESMKDLARRYSEDEHSAALGGDIGFQERVGLIPEFAELLFSMKQGELYEEPFKSRYGYHVVRLEAIKPAKRSKFDEVRETIHERIRNLRSSSVLQDLMNAKREAADIKVFDDRLNLISFPE